MNSRPVKDAHSKTEQTNKQQKPQNKHTNNNIKQNKRVGKSLRNNLPAVLWPPCPWHEHPCTCTQTGMYTCAHTYMAETKFPEVKTLCHFWVSLCPDSNYALCKLGLNRMEQAHRSSNSLWGYCPSLQVTPVWTMPPALGLQHFRRKIKVCSERNRANVSLSTWAYLKEFAPVTRSYPVHWQADDPRMSRKTLGWVLSLTLSSKAVCCAEFLLLGKRSGSSPSRGLWWFLPTANLTGSRIKSQGRPVRVLE